MKHLLFVRHAESVSNAGGVTMPHAEIPLSEQGLRQANALAGLLPASPSRIYCSPFVRAISTAEPYGRLTGVELTLLDELREFSAIDPALLEGMTGAQRRPIADAYWAEGDPEKRMGTDAETFSEFRERVLLGMERLATLENGCVLFGHGIWLGLAYWLSEGNSVPRPDEMHAFRSYQAGIALPNGGCHRVSLDGQGGCIIRFDTDIQRSLSEAL